MHSVEITDGTCVAPLLHTLRYQIHKVMRRGGALFDLENLRLRKYGGNMCLWTAACSGE